MNRKLYSMLCENFNKPKTQDQYDLWKEIFSDKDIYHDTIVERTIKYIIENDKYMPSVARIKEVYEEMRKSPLTEKEKVKIAEKKGILFDWWDYEKDCVKEQIKNKLISENEQKELQEEWDMLFS